MLEWTLSHPWLTTLIVLTLIGAVSGIINNILRVLNNRLVLAEIKIRSETGWGEDTYIPPQWRTSSEKKEDNSGEDF